MRGVEENDCEGEEEPWDESGVFRRAGYIRDLVIFSKLFKKGYFVTLHSNRCQKIE